MKNQMPTLTQQNQLVSTIADEIRKSLLLSPLGKSTNILVVDPSLWEFAFAIYPPQGITVSKLIDEVESILYSKCRVDKALCKMVVAEELDNMLIWSFIHPDAPKRVKNIVRNNMLESDEVDVSISLPKPNGTVSRSDTIFLTLKNEYFEQILCGKKRIEYRSINQYYCNKFFAPGIKKRFVKFNRGYTTGKKNQMIFKIKSIGIVNDLREKLELMDSKGNMIKEEIPNAFNPEAYYISLGQRVA